MVALSKTVQNGVELSIETLESFDIEKGVQRFILCSPSKSALYVVDQLAQVSSIASLTFPNRLP